MLFAAHRALYGSFLALCADAVPRAAEAVAAEIDGAVSTVAEATRAAIVCVATPARKPVVMNADTRPGTHFNALGADAPGKQEIDPKLLAHARIFVDDWEQATHSGEVNVPLHEGFLARDQIVGTLGEVIEGTVRGRIRDAKSLISDGKPSEITLFDSTGLAVHDIAVARLAYRLAEERGVGIEVDLVGA